MGARKSVAGVSGGSEIKRKKKKKDNVEIKEGWTIMKHEILNVKMVLKTTFSCAIMSAKRESINYWKLWPRRRQLWTQLAPWGWTWKGKSNVRTSVAGEVESMTTERTKSFYELKSCLDWQMSGSEGRSLCKKVYPIHFTIVRQQLLRSSLGSCSRPNNNSEQFLVFNSGAS